MTTTVTLPAEPSTTTALEALPAGWKPGVFGCESVPLTRNGEKFT